MKIKNQKTLFQGYIFSLVERVVEIEGKDYTRDIILHHGGVAIVAVEKGKILLVSQSRVGADKKLLEIPAGTLEKGEDPIECAKRELNEEAGLECKSLSLICSFYPTPGYCSEKIWIYQAHDLSQAREKLAMDEGEDISQVWIEVEKAFDMIKSGEIEDGKTIIALQHLMLEKEDRA